MLTSIGSGLGTKCLCIYLMLMDKSALILKKKSAACICHVFCQSSAPAVHGGKPHKVTTFCQETACYYT